MKKIPLLIAHRGASFQFPENTIPAFVHAACDLHADMIELDVRLTRDGVPIVLHDASLERTTNGQGQVSERTYEDIATLDAGYHFDPEGIQQFPMRGKGARIPSFEEVLDRLPETRFAVEIKETSEELVEKIVELLRSRGMLETAIAGSKYHFVSQCLERLKTPLKQFASRREIVHYLIEQRTSPKQPVPCPNRVVSIPPSSWKVSLHSREWIEFLHKKNMTVMYWTVDDKEMMLRLADNGADGIMTNNLETAHRVFGKTS